MGQGHPLFYKITQGQITTTEYLIKINILYLFLLIMFMAFKKNKYQNEKLDNLNNYWNFCTCFKTQLLGDGVDIESSKFFILSSDLELSDLVGEVTLAICVR